MTKKIMFYTGIYLFFYLVIIFLTTIVQWGYFCDFDLSTCSLKLEKLHGILQTSAPILTPIVVIWGFYVWKDQEIYKKSKELLASILTQTNQVYETWQRSRSYSDIDTRFKAYCFFKESMNHELLADSQKSKEEMDELKNIYLLLNNIYFSINHLHIINKNIDIREIKNRIDEIAKELESNMIELSEFQTELLFIKHNYSENRKSEEEMIKICHKLDIGSAPLGSIDEYQIVIREIFKRTTDEIIKLNDELN